jgi:hypothetical protein
MCFLCICVYMLINGFKTLLVLSFRVIPAYCLGCRILYDLLLLRKLNLSVPYQLSPQTSNPKILVHANVFQRFKPICTLLSIVVTSL